MKLEPGQIAIVFTPVVDDDKVGLVLYTQVLLFGDEKHKFAMRTLYGHG
jgi:hypothetical protein